MAVKRYSPWRLLSDQLSNPTIKTLFHVISGNFIITVLTAVSGIIVPRWVEPVDMGMWNTVSLVMVYTSFLQLGVFSGLNREFPYLVGQGNNKRALELAESANAWSIVLSLSTLGIMLPISVVFMFGGNVKLIASLLALAICLALSWINSYLVCVYRMHSDFSRLTRNNIIVAVIGVILILLVWQFGYYGYLLRVSVLAGLGVLALYFQRPVKVKPIFKFRSLVTLAKIGIPIIILGHLTSFFQSMDKLFLTKNQEALGLFTIAVQVGVAARIASVQICAVLYPYMAENYGRTGSAISMWKIAVKGGLGSLTCSLVIGVVGYFMVPIIVNNILPKYSAGIAAAQWSCFLGVVCAAEVFNNIFNILGRQDIYFITWIIGLAGFWIAWEMLQGNGTLTTAAAQSMLIGTALSSVASVFFSRLACQLQMRKNQCMVG